MHRLAAAAMEPAAGGNPAAATTDAPPASAPAPAAPAAAERPLTGDAAQSNVQPQTQTQTQPQADAGPARPLLGKRRRTPSQAMLESRESEEALQEEKRARRRPSGGSMPSSSTGTEAHDAPAATVFAPVAASAASAISQLHSPAMTMLQMAGGAGGMVVGGPQIVGWPPASMVYSGPQGYALSPHIAGRMAIPPTPGAPMTVPIMGQRIQGVVPTSMYSHPQQQYGAAPVAAAPTAAPATSVLPHNTAPPPSTLNYGGGLPTAAPPQPQGTAVLHETAVASAAPAQFVPPLPIELNLVQSGPGSDSDNTKRLLERLAANRWLREASVDGQFTNASNADAGPAKRKRKRVRRPRHQQATTPRADLSTPAGQADQAVPLEAPFVDSDGGSSDKLPPGRRRKHVCTPNCHHVCATVGCNEMLTAAAARSRYIRCARCRKLGPAAAAAIAAPDSSAGGSDMSDVELKAEPSETSPSRKGKPAPLVGNFDDASDSADELGDNFGYPEPRHSISSKGRIRVPARVFSPASGGQIVRQGQTFGYTDEDGKPIEPPPRRPSSQLTRGSPRIAKVFSPLPNDDDEGDDDDLTYTEREEPRAYISQAPNWFYRPPVGISPAVVEGHIARYHAALDAVRDKERAGTDAERKVDEALAPTGGGGGEATERPSTPETGAATDPHSAEAEAPTNQTPSPAARDRKKAAPRPMATIPSARTSPADDGDGWLMDQDADNARAEGSGSDVERPRSVSVTVGLPPDDEEDDAEADDGEEEEPIVDKFLLRKYRVRNFDQEKCRKCQINFDNDDDDLLRCEMCPVVFHAGCEEPALTWSPTEVFCSQFCYERFITTPRGIEMLRENYMLASGHLKKYSECLSNDGIDSALTKPPMRLQQGLKLFEPAPITELRLEPGQCVSLRAEPHVNDPRVDWPAVIRHVWYHKSGAPLFYCTWLEPTNPDKSSYAPLPGGMAQSTTCMSPTCMVRCGAARAAGRICYSATCRQRSNGSQSTAAPPSVESSGETTAVKQPSRLRIAMSAADLGKVEKPVAAKTGEAPKQPKPVAVRSSSGASAEPKGWVSGMAPVMQVKRPIQLAVAALREDEISDAGTLTAGETTDDGGTDMDTADDGTDGYTADEASAGFDSDAPEAVKDEATASAPEVRSGTEQALATQQDAPAVQKVGDDQDNDGDDEKAEEEDGDRSATKVAGEKGKTGAGKPPERAGRAKSSRSRGSKSQKGADADTKGKRPIVCSCGRVFANGQALGGHRGKCKVPRERMRQARDGTPEASGGKPDKPAQGRAKPSQAAKESVRAAATARRQNRPGKNKARKDIRGRSKTHAKKPIPEEHCRPVYSIVPFHPDDYKLGRNERRPQVAACIVKVHPFKFDVSQMPDTFLTSHRQLARAKFSYAKLDDMQTDGRLNGPYEEPETDRNRAVLTFSREVPRKLAFIAPGGGTNPDSKPKARPAPRSVHSRPSTPTTGPNGSTRVTRSASPALGLSNGPSTRTSTPNAIATPSAAIGFWTIGGLDPALQSP